MHGSRSFSSVMVSLRLELNHNLGIEQRKRLDGRIKYISLLGVLYIFSPSASVFAGGKANQHFAASARIDWW